MARLNLYRIVAIALSLVVASSVIAQCTLAQSIPKPSVPEFTIKLVDRSYDVPATYSTDTYTGEKVLVEPAHHVNNGTIELWIKNQQYTYSNGSLFRIYYDVRTGGHFGGGVELYPPFKAPLGPNMDTGWFIATNAPMQSDSSYTIVSISSVHPPQTTPTATYPPNAKIDFQVKALIGHDSKLYGSEHLGGIWSLYPAVALDTESDWSNVYTLNLSDGKISVTSSPIPTPSIPELSWLALLPLCLIVLFVAFVLKRQKSLGTLRL